MTSVTPYTDLITSEHADKPNYMAMVGATCQPGADLSALYASIPLLYDVDVAVGEQLDVVGQWIGVDRYLTEPITGVYFSFGTVGVGFGQGVWQGPYDPVTGLVALSDYYYRLVLKVRILNNHWNGSKQDAYTLVNAIFSVLGYVFFIQDPADLTMQQGLVGSGPPDALVQALFIGGKFNIKPAGVRISAYIYQSAPGPIFSFGLNNANFAGFGTGSWATIVPT